MYRINKNSHSKECYIDVDSSSENLGKTQWKMFEFILKLILIADWSLEKSAV